MSTGDDALLELHKVHKDFAGVTAVDGLSMTVRRKDILGLLGPNGAGKTTVFNLITGVYPLTSGAITFSGEVIHRLSPHRIVKRGIARTYQNIRLFESMTVREHIQFGQTHRMPSGMKRMLDQGQVKALKEEAEDILHFLGIWTFRDVPALSLSYGQQRRVEIGRALATGPQLILLDEPTAGMNLDEKREVLEILAKIHDKGTAIIVIEHDMRVVMNTCNRIVMLNFGEKIAEGSPAEIYKDVKAKEVYLGKA